MSKSHLPIQPAPSPEDDPTGVRALLSGLPEPDPMPGYLVERITASLAAAQSQRAASFTSAPVTALVPRSRRRLGRGLLAIAGAAAVVLIAVVGTNLFKINQSAGSLTSASSAITSGHQRASSEAPPAFSGKGAPDAASTAAVIQIRVSETRYTKAKFTAQARTLGDAVFGPSQPKSAASRGIVTVDTAAGLTQCLRAVGVVDPQMVRADLAFYEGSPAVIIVATTNNVPMAYALGRQCSVSNAAVLHPATPLP